MRAADHWRDAFESALRAALPSKGQSPLAESMHYAMFPPGKCIRPAVVIRCNEMLGGELTRALPAACAIELVHVFSLVHDDLPAFDNDDMRRGRPSCHKKFDEATATLAGNALMNQAFAAIAGSALVAPLSKAIQALLNGQMGDIQGSKNTAASQLRLVCRRKTGALFAFAMEAGAIINGSPHTEINRLRKCGEQMGLAFQIVDDLLDADDNDSISYTRHYGPTLARTLAKKHLQAVYRVLRPYGTRSHSLLELVTKIESRIPSH